MNRELRSESGESDEVATAREMLRAWFEGKNNASVHFRENLHPELDPDASDVLAYEASFTPEKIHKTRVEVWITGEGHFSVGLELKHRVAERLGVPKTGYNSFAAGVEPSEVISEKELISVLELAAGGQIALRVVAVPFLGVLSTKVSVPWGTKTRIGLDSPHWHWLHERGSTLPRLGQIVEYEPW